MDSQTFALVGAPALLPRAIKDTGNRLVAALDPNIDRVSVIDSNRHILVG